MGRLASICNGLVLKLKTLSSTHTAAPPHRQFSHRQLQWCCQLYLVQHYPKILVVTIDFSLMR
jgi:hypothetical protein